MKKSHYKNKHYKTNNKPNYSTKSKTNFNPKLLKFLTVLLLFLLISATLATIAKFVPEITIKIKKGLNITSIIVFALAGFYVICKTNKKYDWIKKLFEFLKKIAKKCKDKYKDKNYTSSQSKHKTTDTISNTSINKPNIKHTQKKYSTSHKYKRQNYYSRRLKNYKNNNQKTKSYRFPLELDADGYFCTYIDEDEFLYRVDLGITKEIEDISQYQVRIRIRIEDNYIQSANLFYNDEVSEQIKVLNPDALQ